MWLSKRPWYLRPTERVTDSLVEFLLKILTWKPLLPHGHTWALFGAEAIGRCPVEGIHHKLVLVLDVRGSGHGVHGATCEGDALVAETELS